ncbi:MAG: ABC transporter ATP-binding protein [Candidatus Sumerlaeaceae bacterium]|nr:ABC transporter ATP-binding protein [Candidatus Sumerlaeaceae bacterium]
MIQTFGLVKQYKNLTAVNSLDLTVNEGEIFGFIGPNGAGKTTTIRMLATLTKPTSGHALVAGYNILTQADEVKRVIGYMPDSFGVYEDMKVWEYLDFFAAAYKIPKEKRGQIVDDVLNLTDLIYKKDDYVEALSKGMKQRLCLAKTLVHDPKVLLLDEPASGLDPRARIELRELLKELCKMGKTILVSSHILTELADFCTSIGIIEQGRLLAAGKVDDILKNVKASKVVKVTVRENAEKGRELMAAHPNVKSAEIEGNVVIVHLDLSCEDTSFIAEELLKNGIKFTSMKEEELDLEDIFMKITTGAVQ